MALEHETVHGTDNTRGAPRRRGRPVGRGVDRDLERRRLLRRARLDPLRPEDGDGEARARQDQLHNDSTAAHNVSLEHNGEFEYGATLTIHKGVATTFLTLAKGTYHVYSSVGKDEDRGMAATLIVK